MQSRHSAKHNPHRMGCGVLGLPHGDGCATGIGQGCCDGREVKALDSKSNRVSLRRFESCSQRWILADAGGWLGTKDTSFSFGTRKGWVPTA